MAVLFDEKGEYVGPSDLNAPELNVTQAPPGKGAEVMAARQAAMERGPMKLSPEVQAMSGPERFGRATLGALAEPVHGAIEKAQIAFPGRGREAETLAKIEAERVARRGLQRELESTPGGMFGGVIGKGLPLAATTSPFGAAALAGGLGFLGGGEDKPEGLGSELGASLVRGGIEGAATYLPARGVAMAGRGVGAATGRLTDAGVRAKEIEEAAARLGLPTPSFGQTYPGGMMEGIERATGRHADLVEEQARALHAAITKDTPYGVPDVGGKYLDMLRQAVQNRYDAGAQMYRNVDDIVNSQGLGRFMPGYTANVVTNTKNPGYATAIEQLEKYGFPASTMQGMKAAQLGKIPLSFENFNTMRVATNKAWGNINRQIETAQVMGNTPSSELKAARSYLDDLRTALDNDAERWAAQSAGNKEAVTAFREATKYWKEQVVPTVVENPFARKVSSGRRGFTSGEQATRLSLGTANRPLVDRLLPTMSGPAEDTTLLLRTLPEVRAKTLQDEVVHTPRGGLHALGQAAEGRRDATTLERLAAMTQLPQVIANTLPARRLAGARNVFGGAAPNAVLKSTLVPYGASGLQEYGEERLHARP